jgi:hypothetical protein
MRALWILCLLTLLAGCGEDFDVVTHDASPMPTGRDIAWALFAGECTHEQTCDRLGGETDWSVKACAQEMTRQFCLGHECAAPAVADSADVRACASDAEAWQCHDPASNVPNCVLELLETVPGRVL